MAENSKIQWTDHTPKAYNGGAPTKLGLSADEWKANRANGNLWCYCCRQWKPIDAFGLDKSWSSGRASACKVCVSHKGTASRYGITVEQARELRSGDAVCHICGRKQKLEVDHNHKSGKVRGVLCSRCNGALGQFCDDPALLRKAITYLEERDGSDN